MSKKVTKDSEFMIFVKGELDKLSTSAVDPGQMLLIRKAVVPLCELFEKMGKVGGAKSKIVLRLFAKLASWTPLTALTGEDEEWEKVNEGELEDNDILYQNKRCPHVYKRKDGTCFDANGTVFSYNGIVWFRNKDSNKDISFPYEVPVSPQRVMLDANDIESNEKYS